ncbi:MAG: rRNA pseudouridine synthase [Candidatus Sumerlaeaceae bacterium]|nr:rRNA pseudouridine synthase [Candidatus Sumerlaeaceae bacterium]
MRNPQNKNDTAANAEKPVRLQKFLAACGVASRRRCEILIAEGRVRINGALVTEMGTTINPATDEVRLNGAVVRPPDSGLVYYLLNKPRGYLVTASDQRGRRTIYEILGAIRERVVPVGRLDMDSEGLLLLTNDGELAHRLMHPSYRVEKEYEVVVRGSISTAAISRLRKGLPLDGKVTQPAKVQLLGKDPNGSRLRITITEGRKRQVRRMMDAVGHSVISLRRVREGALQLGSLLSGKCRPLEANEIELLKHETGLGRPK